MSLKVCRQVKSLTKSLQKIKPEFALSEKIYGVPHFRLDFGSPLPALIGIPRERTLPESAIWRFFWIGPRCACRLLSGSRSSVSTRRVSYQVSTEGPFRSKAHTPLRRNFSTILRRGNNPPYGIAWMQLSSNSKRGALHAGPSPISDLVFDHSGTAPCRSNTCSSI
jgi:hypothetical protein